MRLPRQLDQTLRTEAYVHLNALLNALAVSGRKLIFMKSYSFPFPDELGTLIRELVTPARKVNDAVTDDSFEMRQGISQVHSFYAGLHQAHTKQPAVTAWQVDPYLTFAAVNTNNTALRSDKPAVQRAANTLLTNLNTKEPIEPLPSLKAKAPRKKAQAEERPIASVSAENPAEASAVPSALRFTDTPLEAVAVPADPRYPGSVFVSNANMPAGVEEQAMLIWI